MSDCVKNSMDAFKIGKLEEYIKTLSEESLKVVLDNITVKEIRDAVKQEIVYRKLCTLFKDNEKVAYYISKYFYEEVFNFNLDSVDEITEFYRVGDDSRYLSYLQWMPVGLSLDAIYAIYKRLLSENKTPIDIAVLYTTDIEECLEIYESSDKNINLASIKEDADFKKFIYDCLLYCEKNKSETQSFNRMYVELEYENKELLRKLQ